MSLDLLYSLRNRLLRMPGRANRSWLWPLCFVLTLALSTALSHSLIDALHREQALLMGSARVERELHEILQLTVDAETATRGFLLTQDPDFLTPLTQSLPRLGRSLETLRTLTPIAAGKADGTFAILEHKVRQRLANALAAKANAEAGKPLRLDRLRASRQLQDDIRSLVGQLSKKEQALRKASTERAAVLAGEIKAANLLSALVLAVLGVMWWRARRRLKDTQDNYRSLFSSAASGMALIGDDGRIVEANRSFAAMLGRADGELTGTDFVLVEAAGERGYVTDALHALVKGDRDVVRGERLYLRPDCGEVWLRSTMSRARDAAHGRPQVLLIAEDVTQRVRSDELLRRSSVLLSNAGRMAAIDGWFLALPSGALQLGAYMKQRLRLGDKAAGAFLARLDGRSRRTLLAALSRCRRAGRAIDVEIDLVGGDAAPMVLRVLGQAARGPQGLVGVEGAVQDITEQRRVQRKLRKSEQRFRAAAQVSNDGIWDWDIAAGTMWRSSSIAMLVGLGEQELGAGIEAWQRLIHPDDLDRVREAFTPVMEGRADELTAEYRVRRVDGSYAWVQDNARVLRDESGAIVRMVGGIRDLTERRRIQAAMMGMAASVPSGDARAYFQVLLQHLVQALGADGGAIARPDMDRPGYLRTIACQVDGRELDVMDYALTGSPCATLMTQDECVVLDDIAGQCPEAGGLPGLVARGYAGRRLTAADDHMLGVMFLLFREPIVEREVLGAVLRVFATRAAAEMERLDAAGRMQEQAALLDHAREAITVLGLDLVLRFWNCGAESMYGMPAGEAVGSPVLSCYLDQDVPRAALAAILADGEWRGESKQLRRGGGILTVDESWTLVRGADGRPDVILKVGSDVTEKRATEEQVRRLAYYDTLTGLPNRRLLMDRLAQLRLRSARQGRCGALLFIDMDNFKRLNDEHGHDAGDEFLRQTAGRLTACVRANDTVARLGGDEFVVLLDGLDADPQAASQQAYAVGANIVGAFRQPVDIGPIAHRSTASVGVVVVCDDRKPVDELLRRADQAMYRAKNGGRNGVMVDSGAAGDAQMSPGEDLALALREGQVRLALRAEVDAAGRENGAAVTPCWPGPSGPQIAGGELLALAERCGLMPVVETWLLERCAAILAHWSATPARAGYRLALPLARHQLRDPLFCARLLAVLAAHGCRADRLVLELPQAGFEGSTASANVEALRAAGVRVVLADFGLDASSFGLLRRLALDGVCLDPRLVRGSTGSIVDAVLMRSMLGLADSLGLSVVAEGVTEHEQQALLTAAGCRQLRGPLFGTMEVDAPQGGPGLPPVALCADDSVELAP